jgi:heme/copper-type cytochrome/quinol oxidase subunit 1
MAPVETEAPPVGEEIHMPEPSLIPILNAVGLSLAIVGITLSMVVTAIGVVLFLVTTVRWVRDARHELSELPAEHRAAH